MIAKCARWTNIVLSNLSGLIHIIGIIKELWSGDKTTLERLLAARSRYRETKFDLHLRLYKQASRFAIPILIRLLSDIQSNETSAAIQEFQENHVFFLQGVEEDWNKMKALKPLLVEMESLEWYSQLMDIKNFCLVSFDDIVTYITCYIMSCKKSPHIMPIVKYFFTKLVCFHEAFLYIIKFVNCMYVCMYLYWFTGGHTGLLVFWESWQHHVVSCEEMKICKILGLNVKIKTDESKILPVMKVD